MNSADAEREPTRPTHAAVAVIRDDSRFLAIKRAEGIRAAGKICFPGGGIEQGESEEAALVREMKEELGVVVEPRGKIWSSVTPWGVHVHWICAVMLPGKIVVDAAEVQWARWMEKEELWAHPDLLESNRQFFAALNDGAFDLPGIER